LLSFKKISQGGTRQLTLNGPVVGTGGINKLSTGLLILNGTNSYSGDTQISNGTVSINDFSQLGTATTPITMGGSTVGGALVIRAADQSTDRGLAINPFGASIDYAGGLTINGPVTSGNLASGSLTKIGAGTLTLSTIRIGGTLNATTGRVVMKPNGSDAASNRVGTLTRGGGGAAWSSRLHLNDNDLVIDYTGDSPIATITSQLTSGYATGAWLGNGITSSTAAALASSQHKTALGYTEASALGLTAFSGQTVDADSIVIKYTYSGDANLDGTVNALDFNAVASNFGSAAVWSGGDFNYDSVVNASDFTALGQNFGQTMPAPALGTIVPEPISQGAIALLMAAMSRRRRELAS